MKKLFLALFGALVWLANFSGVAFASVVVYDFSSPVLTGPSQAPNTWYTDRYTPAGFMAAGGMLMETISPADGAAFRPPSYTDLFYNTQGRKFDLNDGVSGQNTSGLRAVGLSVDLYISSNWAAMNQRIGGIWGTAYDNANNLISYPILEFTTDGNNPRLHGWDDSGWIDYALPGGFNYNIMHTIGFELDAALDKWNYMLDGNLLGSVDAFGSSYLDNTILQAYNNYSNLQQMPGHTLFWDNLTVTSVPEPSSLALLGISMVGLIASRRLKPKKGYSKDIAFA